MKARKIILLFSIAIGLMTLMSTTCEKDDPDNPDPNTCDGFVTATASGNISTNFCFDILNTYENTNNESATLNVRQEGNPEYACGIYVYTLNGPGTYNCGYDEPCFIELILHGDDNEFYKSQSGTLTITQVDEANFKATFNVVTVGYYNEQTVNFSGTVSFNGVVD